MSNRTLTRHASQILSNFSFFSPRQALKHKGLASIYSSPTSRFFCNEKHKHDPVDSTLLHKQINKMLDEVDASTDSLKASLPPKTIDGTSPELEDIISNNRRWVSEKNKTDPTFFQRLGAGQRPRYLYIGCSDARVDPGQLMGLKNGELFVHRNVGNVVSGTDLNFLTVLEYAVDVLKVPHIIVCGHYDCGAVRGSIARPDQGGLGMIENWLRNIRDVARLHMEELKAIKDDELRQRRLVELNVMEQCLNIFKVECVQRRRLKTFLSDDQQFALPRVHGLAFDVRDGILNKLPIDFKKEIEEFREIYDLYKIPTWVKRRTASNTSASDDSSDGNKQN